MDFMKLADFRKQYGLSQVQVARAAKVSLTAYQNWERGTSEPNTENNERLLDFIEKTIKDSIVKGE